MSQKAVQPKTGSSADYFMGVILPITENIMSVYVSEMFNKTYTDPKTREAVVHNVKIYFTYKGKTEPQERLSYVILKLLGDVEVTSDTVSIDWVERLIAEVKTVKVEFVSEKFNA